MQGILHNIIKSVNELDLKEWSKEIYVSLEKELRKFLKSPEFSWPLLFSFHALVKKAWQYLIYIIAHETVDIISYNALVCYSMTMAFWVL